MILKKLSVRNFRNIASADFEFSPKVNIFTGSNAQGKTNLCEAISLCFGKSFRNPKVTELLPVNSDEHEIRIELTFVFDNMQDKENVILYTQKNNISKLKFNGLEMKSAEELYGALRYVIFIPEDLYIVKGNPENRRDYIDFVSNMINRVHNSKIYEYNKALKQKNNLLAKTENLNEFDIIALDSWNETIAKLGVNIMFGRLKYFNILSELADKYYGQINSRSEKLTMKYVSTIIEDRDINTDDPEEMFREYMSRLTETRQRELRMKYTVVGVHRDDISFFINNMESRDFASQGQIRSIAVALKLAEAEMIYSRSKDVPVIILDDVLSELDEYRRNFIINHIDNFQTFITSCNISDIDRFENGKIWQVENGSFRLI